MRHFFSLVSFLLLGMGMENLMGAVGTQIQNAQKIFIFLEAPFIKFNWCMLYIVLLSLSSCSQFLLYAMTFKFDLHGNWGFIEYLCLFKGTNKSIILSQSQNVSITQFTPAVKWQSFFLRVIEFL